MSETETKKKSRRGIQKALEDAAAERHRQLLRARLEVAHMGLRAYESRNFAEAVKNFQGYLKIVEELKGVSTGGLHPGLFDRKADLPELLLLSGIYWDLTKLFDRTQKTDKQKLFRQYLDKYILFSKGMPFEPLAVETLRKYIAMEKALHMAEFKNAFQAMGGKRCFVAGSLVDVINPETPPALRDFRDRVLKRTRAGRAFILWYYRQGPALARGVDRLPRFARFLLARALDRLSRFL